LLLLELRANSPFIKVKPPEPVIAPVMVLVAPAYKLLIVKLKPPLLTLPFIVIAPLVLLIRFVVAPNVTAPL
jgi:hypothetical protein